MEDVDEEISAVREEIRRLTARRQVLSASLLSSTHVRTRLESHLLDRIDADAPSAVLDAGRHAETNHHRIIFSTTSFPFRDPSPHTDSPDLLGVRIDINVRDGTFVRPYYLLLKRVGEDRKSFQIHRHSIPVFIPLKQLEQRHLPWCDPRGDSVQPLKPWKRKKQNLKMLVRELRRELVSWHVRTDVVSLLQELLGTATSYQSNAETAVRPDSLAYSLGLLSVSAASIEARYVRLQWQDGRIGRVKISNQGLVERAIIIGDGGRDKITETLIAGGDRRAENIVRRLVGSKS